MLYPLNYRRGHRVQCGRTCSRTRTPTAPARTASQSRGALGLVITGRPADGAALACRYHDGVTNDLVANDARDRLRDAMALHASDDIDGALAAASDAIAISPEFGEAHAYIGNTLVTRRRQFADGLAAMERAVELRPHDATTLYTLGWCREFVAHALGRKRERHQPVAEDAPTLYAAARASFLRALELDPDDGLRGDIEDMLDVIASATGEPWDEQPYKADS